jgi:hypothetical protein
MMLITGLAIILLILSEGSYSNCRLSHENDIIVYCVTTAQQQCNATLCEIAAECKTWDFFIRHSSMYFKSSTTFLFQSGYHDHNSQVIVNNMINMKFIGVPNSKMSIINCTQENVGFLFHNFTGVVFENLTIINCGQVFMPHYPENSDIKRNRSAALAFDTGTDLTLKSINVTHSKRQGFCINQVQGNISILSSIFQHAVSRDQNNMYNVAGNSMFSANCYSNSPKPMALIRRSRFIKNSNTDLSFTSKDSHDQHTRKCLTFASGLLIVLKCTNFAVTFDEVIFDGNEGCKGGNLAIVFFNTSKPFTKSLTINNSVFQNGRASAGGGILVSFVEAVKVDRQGNCSDGGTKPRDILKITNTSFLKNMVCTCGAGILLRLKNSLTSCVSSSRISLDNCTFQGNIQTGYGGVAIQSENYRSFQYKKQLLPQFDLSITNSRFFENHVAYYDGSGSGVILVKDSYHVKISDVEIYNNINCSGLLAIGSNFIFTGETNIHNNSASSGGGILLCSDAIMFLQPYAQLIITNNSAVHTGGGICVEERCMISPPVCFFQLDLNATINFALISTINITIANNRADHAGGQLFGGSVDYCYLIDSPYHNRSTNQSLPVYNEIFHITPNSSSMITSPERQVCICDGSGNYSINCTRTYVLPSVYPGKTFQIVGVLVGQLNGTLPGTVKATLVNPDSHDYHLAETDIVQDINSSHCSSLNYTIMTHKACTSNVTLKLEAKFVGDKSFADRLRIFEPLLVTVSFKRCPIGFSLSTQSGKCECLSALKSIVSCDIQDNSLSLNKDNWIGYDKTLKRILYSYGYSFDYCYPNATVVNIEDYHSQNAQCRHNRVGVVCGKCKDNHSVVLGSSQCRDDCKQLHLLLIPVFGLAGLILVVILIVLNMTVTVGTLNGLIFYANMVQLSNTQYFQDDNRIPHFITGILKVFIAWFNLDLGIETCLYKGMDDYTKAWLQFIFPLYIWLILALIVYLSRRYSFASTLIGNNGVKVLATLVLLSYSKMLRAAIATAHMKFIYHIPRDGSYDHRHICWIFDCNIPGFKGKHIPLFIAGLTVSLVLLPFTFVLLSIRHLNKISNWPFFCWVWRLKPLFDAYTGPFTNEARCWTGVLCFVRLVLFITSTISSSGLANLTVGLSNIAAICLLFFAHTRIYKKKWLHILESSFILNLGALSMGTLFCRYGGYVTLCSALTHLLVGVAFIMFLGIVGYHVHTQLNDNVTKFFRCSKFVKRMIMRICNSKPKHDVRDDSATSDDDLFHNIERRHLLPKVS